MSDGSDTHDCGLPGGLTLRTGTLAYTTPTCYLGTLVP